MSLQLFYTWVFQRFLAWSTIFEKYMKSSMTPTIDASEVTINETFQWTFQWTFSGLNVNVSQCRLNSIHMIVEPDSWPNVHDRKRFIENPQIIIHNSSFGALDLEPGTKAQITECYLDGEFKLRPTLITANNSTLTIQNCQFEDFINENDSTVLFGQNNSHVTIKNSVFIQHNSSKGVLFLENNFSMHISGSLISQNVAFTVGYSTITLKDGIHAVIKNTTFKNNTALAGGALNAENQCQVVLMNCTLSSNKATTGEAPDIQKISNSQRTSHSFYGNETYKPVSPPTLFNLTSSRYLPGIVHTRDPNKTRSFTSMFLPLFNLTSHRKKIAAHRVYLKVRSFASMKNSSQQKDVSPGFGGAINIEVQSHLLVLNCVFENNSAETGGAITAQDNVTLDVKGTTFVGNQALYQGGAIAAEQNVTLDMKETSFVGNKALKYGGAIEVKQQTYLQITNCVFEDNTCQQLGGAITGTGNVTLDIHKTNFTRNSAVVQGGAIDIDTDAHLRATHCTFNDNYAGQGGAIAGSFCSVLEINRLYFSENSASSSAGAIMATNNVTLDIYGITFVGNKALIAQGGAIFAKQNVALDIQETTFVGNKASYIGGAIVAQHNATLTVRETSFVGNIALNFAGAIDMWTHAHLKVKNCSFDENVGSAICGRYKAILDVQETNFTRNTADQGGAINVKSDVYLRAVDCIFHGNHAGRLGGAIFVLYETDLEINRSYFLENNATSTGAIFASGSVKLDVQETSFVGNDALTIGTILIHQKSYLGITNCLFANNTSRGFGTIYGVTNVTMGIEGTNFTRNSVDGDGGAINVRHQANLSLTNCRLDRNSARYGGAVFAQYNVTLKMRETSFTGNSASRNGGALSISQSQCHIVHSVFNSNTAKTGGGGAMHIDSRVSLKRENTDFINNNGSEGGAINIESGAVQFNNPEYVSLNNTFSLRNVELGTGTDVIIDNITCVGNHATGDGGCLYINTATLTLNNSNISQNGADEYGSAIHASKSRIQVGFHCLRITFVIFDNFSVIFKKKSPAGSEYKNCNFRV